MKNKNEKLMSAFDHIDSRYIGEAMEYYGEKSAKKPVFAKRINRYVAVASAAAACLLIIALALPSLLIERGADSYTPTDVRAEDTDTKVQTPPEHDGSKGLLYEINEDGKSASFVGFGTCTEETVVIASTYDGLPVTRMYNKGYWEAETIPVDHDFNSKYLKRLVISDTVQTVDFECIRQCPNIESIYFGSRVNHIGALFFGPGYGENFSSVEVSPDNKYFSDKGNCIVDLRTGALVLATPTTVIPNDGSVKIIGNSAFGSARRHLTSIVIPEGVRMIDHGAFRECQKLENIVLPNSLEIIESCAFDGCHSLKTLELGVGLKVYNQDVFFTCIPKTQIIYKGTVAQWESIAKNDDSPELVDGTPQDPIVSTVYCTDGETYSNAGNLEQYRWWFMPEYSTYWEIQYLTPAETD